MVEEGRRELTQRCWPSVRTSLTTALAVQLELGHQAFGLRAGKRRCWRGERVVVGLVPRGVLPGLRRDGRELSGRHGSEAFWQVMRSNVSSVGGVVLTVCGGCTSVDMKKNYKVEAGSEARNLEGTRGRHRRLAWV